MAWAWTYLAVSVLGALFVLNAFRPVRNGLVVVQSFFAGWYTAEMPVWHIVWQAAATVVFAYLGAFGSWPGWLGLGVAVASWVGLGVHAMVAQRAGTVFEAAESQVPLPAAPGVELPRSGRDTMWRFPRLIWPMPKPTRVVTSVRNIDYWGDGIHKHKLDVIRRRAHPPTGAPVFVYIHGGAWMIGDKREQGFPLLFELARRGWVCVTINYRLSPRATWPDHIVDCKRALAWVKEHIGEYGGDPGFVAVSGGSAGGHLAALVGLTAGDAAFQPGFEEADTAVDACVPIYGLYDMTAHGGGKTLHERGELEMFEKRIFKLRFAEHPEVFEAASPLYRVRPDAPPFFVIHGRNDTLIPAADAREFVARLRAVSTAPVLHAELPFTQHAFDVLPSVRSAHAVASVVRFLEGVRHHLVSAATERDVPDPTVPEAEVAAPAIS
ncbi:MAG TPA: alpha/beta hydrolase [Acidimicrobiales bacterium]|nr:alpha/beta hydrolase [Acidimicrobiales bacterium]